MKAVDDIVDLIGDQKFHDFFAEYRNDEDVANDIRVGKITNLSFEEAFNYFGFTKEDENK